MKKQVLITFIVCILLCSIIVPVSATYFSDVSAGYWARDAINYVADKGYMTATSGTSFSPTSNMSRADVAELIYKYAAPSSTSGTESFSDVNGSHPRYDAIVWVYSNGIMNGTSSSTFSPGQSIQRQDLAVVLYRYADHCGFDVTTTTNISQYTDSSSVSDYALTAVKWAVAEGIMSGKTSTTLAPHDSVDRQTAATVIMRFGALVEGVRFGRDNFGIINDDIIDCFMNPYYYISADHKSLLYYQMSLMSELNLKYWWDEESGSRISPKERIENKLAQKWKGSCYGMSLAVILNMVGKADFTGNFGITQNCLASFTSLTNNPELESAINYYHLTQFIPSVNEERESNRCWKKDSFSDWKSWWYDLPDIIDEHGLLLLSFGLNKTGSLTEGSGHAVVVYGYSFNTNGLSIKIYDPNKTSTSEINVKNESGIDPISNVLTQTVSVEYSPTETIFYADYIGGFQNLNHLYNRYDLDSYYNDFDINASSAYSTTELTNNQTDESNHSDTVYISLNLSEDFEIINNEGKFLKYSDGVLEGDMEIISEMVPYGENTNTLIIKTNYSSNFHYK